MYGNRNSRKLKLQNGPANEHNDQRMRLFIFKDIGSNAFQGQPHLLVFFESVPSGATKQTLSKRLFYSRAAIFQDARSSSSYERYHIPTGKKRAFIPNQ